MKYNQWPPHPPPPIRPIILKIIEPVSYDQIGIPNIFGVDHDILQVIFTSVPLKIFIDPHLQQTHELSHQRSTVVVIIIIIVIVIVIVINISGFIEFFYYCVLYE